MPAYSPPLFANTFFLTKPLRFRKSALACACTILFLAVAKPDTACAQDAFAPPSATQAREVQLQQRLEALEKRLEKSEKEEKKDEGKKDPDAGQPLPATLPLPLTGKSAFGLTLTAAETPTERVLGVMNGQEIYVLQGMVLHRDPPKPAASQAKAAKNAKQGVQP